MKTIRLTMTQAIVRYLASQFIETDEGIQQIFAGVLQFLVMVMLLVLDKP